MTKYFCDICGIELIPGERIVANKEELCVIIKTMDVCALCLDAYGNIDVLEVIKQAVLDARTDISKAVR